MRTDSSRTTPFARAALAFLFVALAPLGAQAGVATEPRLWGHLRQIDGLDVLFLNGSDDEQAFTEGYLCAPRIRELFLDFALHNPFVPKPAAWDLALRPLIGRTTVVPERLGAWCRAVLRGMEERDPDSTLVAELDRRLTAEDLIAVAALPDFVGLMCSSFAVWGDSVSGGGPIVGRNLDYVATPKLLELAMVTVRTGCAGRVDSVTLGWPGLPGVVTGLSSAGVFLAIHDVPQKKVGRDRCTPRTVALLELLETFTPGDDPAAEAAAVLAGMRYGMGGNVMFAWRGGETAAPGGVVFEISPDDFTEDGVTIRRAIDGQNLVSCSNHFRLRDEPAQCWRFKALFEGASEHEGAFDLPFARSLIRKSQVSMTLHQVCADLGAGQVTFRVRRSQDGSRDGGTWVETGVWSLDELFTEARKGEAVGVGADRDR